MLVYYPIANAFISLVLAYFVTAVSLKKLSNFRIASIIIIGAVLPLSVLFITKNADDLCLCIGALIHLYALFTMHFSPIKLGSISFASAAGQNIGSSSGAGIGSSNGAGVGSSTAANVDSTSLRDEIAKAKAEATKADLEAIKADLEAIKARKEELKEATDNLDYNAFKENLLRRANSILEEQKREIDFSCEEFNDSDSHKKALLDDIEKNTEEYIAFELEARKLLLAAVNSPYAGSWKENQNSPGVILDLVQKSGVNAIHDVLNKDQRKSIYNQCKEAIKYQPYPKDDSLTSNLNKQIAYLNVRARIRLELAALDETKRVNPSVISDEHLKTSKATLSLAEL